MAEPAYRASIAAAAGLFTRKPAESAADATSEGGLDRSVGALELTALGLGAIIGTGIFVIIGEAIGDAGPAIVLSFLLAGVTCVFSALSYAEVASTIPVSGSAYTYAYATLGELVAWIIGWDLVLEYGVSVAAVAVGWGGYLQSLLESVFGVSLPDAIAQPPGDGGSINLPAVVLVLAVTALLIAGVRESARTAVRALAAHRPGDLLRLRPAALAAAQGRAGPRGGPVGRPALSVAAVSPSCRAA